MKAEDLKNSILQLAMEGKLVPQDSNDEPASVLLERIREEKEKLIKEKKIRRNNKESFIFRKNEHFYEKIGKKGEPVCIDDEIPFDIPETWEWCTLGNIISVKGGKRVPKGYKLLDEPTPYIYIRVTNMKNGTNEKNNIKYIDSKVHEQIKNYTIGKDDLYITVAGTIGKVCVVPDYFDGMNLTENANKLTDISINKSFLKYALMSDYIQSQLLDKTTQVAQPKLAIKRIISTKIAIPPLNEQKRIVNKINKLNPLINEYDANKKKLDKLNSKFPEKLKNSILQEAIQGKLVPQNPNDEPASVLLERIRDEKERLIKEKKIKRNKNESYIFKENNHYYEKIGKEILCIDDEIVFEIPKSWQWVRLGDIVYNFGQKKPDKTFSYIDVGSIDNKNLKLNFEENILTKDQAPSRARKIVKEGCIIYSTVRPYLLNMCIINKKFSHEPIASTAFAILNPFTGVSNKYLFYYLQSPIFINYVNKVMSGVAYPAINDKKLYNSIISLPPLKEQIRITEKINSLFEKLNI